MSFSTLDVLNHLACLGKVIFHIRIGYIIKKLSSFRHSITVPVHRNCCGECVAYVGIRNVEYTKKTNIVHGKRKEKHLHALFQKTWCNKMFFKKILDIMQRNGLFSHFRVVSVLPGQFPWESTQTDGTIAYKGLWVLRENSSWKSQRYVWATAEW